MVEQEQESLESLSIRAELLERQAEQIAKQIEEIERIIMEINRTIETLDNIKKLPDENLLPIGSGTYITVKGISNEVFISVGANFLVKKNSEEAKKILEKKIKELGKILEDGRKKMQLIEGLIMDTNKKAAALASRMKNVQST
ncbi:MAG: prefoldin subunit alpha [Candidatus Omnitrophica bacterium]|nr:prefoldin subunit alpha [Candidatus Omnitrophota bacterium]